MKNWRFVAKIYIQQISKLQMKIFKLNLYFSHLYEAFVTRKNRYTGTLVWSICRHSGNSENEDYGPIWLISNLGSTVKHLHGLRKMSFLQILMVSFIKYLYQNGTVFAKTYKSLRVKHDTKSLAFLQYILLLLMAETINEYANWMTVEVQWFSSWCVNGEVMD